MIDSDSQFASEHPHYSGGAYRPQYAQPPSDNDGAAAGASDEGPLANDIYDNAEIDLPEKENEDHACNLDGNADDGPSDAIRAGKDFLSSITKKQWLWAGGITAGIFILRGRK